MRLYNTLSRQVEKFEPMSDTGVRLYTCGPTVYDYAHIGNLRSFIFDDALRRALEVTGHKVKHVMNITDVGHLVSDEDEGEDKLEKGAAREGKTVWQVADSYTQAFIDDIDTLNVLRPNAYEGRPDGFARATDFIDEQLKLVQLLIDKGFAYQTTQAIYFDITKLDDYGKLSGQKITEKEVAVRKEVVSDPDKRHPFDFAVWFFTTGHFSDHTMRWESPWGEGFPGWHLECSAIIHATLGDPIDIHTGGVDHIGTHHPNEMAQTQAAYEHELSRFWLHNEFVLVDGQKMSKSKGNFYTLRDILEKGFDPLAFRLLALQAHYRSQLNFTWESLSAAQNRLNELYAWADLRHQPSADSMPSDLDELFRDTRQTIEEAIRNDLNTPAALASLSTLVTRMQQIPIPGIDGKYTDGTLKFLDSIFGLRLDGRPDISKEQKQILQERHTAREAKNWAKSDELRVKLEEQGITVRDTSYGQIWSRL